MQRDEQRDAPAMPEHPEHLTRRVRELQQENEALHTRVHRLSSERQRLETRMSDLARLYTASTRLRESRTDSELVATFEEILKDLLGSESFAVFELEPDASALSWLGGMGVDSTLPRRIPLGEGPLSFVVQEGRIWVSEPLPTENLAPRACIPLRLGSQVLGVIAIFQLLPHKPSFEAADHVLFELLETQGGMALHCARCPTGGEPLTRGS
ncbi:GAF domain-containing protein [Archangium gephyra]|uniref:GAF domain-containing protein n=2 Tax=Archangium gephyra TaxID=48 RepID=A0ABX9K3Y7_9BACT|nr:GAF domain-containing protein [Archangium gephyra]REG32897.1 GAF domain-containing protein [Archangium gephyra]